MFAKSLAVVALAASLFVFTGCGPTKYDAAALSTPEGAKAKAGSYWKKSGWWSLPDDVKKKVVISEFTVQYVTDRNENISKNQLGLGMVIEAVGVGKRRYDFDGEFKKTLPTDLYNAFVARLEADGYEVVPVSQVAASSVLNDVDAGEEGAKKNIGGRDNAKGEVYSVAGLNRMYAGFMGFGEIKYAKMQPKLLKEFGADIVMRVHMRIGLHKGQATVDEGSNINLAWGLNEWTMPDGSVQYGTKGGGQVVSKETIYRAEPVIDKKQFEAGKGNVYYVNEAEFKGAIMEIFVPYSTMAITKIAD